MKRYLPIIVVPIILLTSLNLYASNDKGKDDKFKCEKNITDLSIVYYGENAVDVVVYDKEKNGSVLQNFSTIEKGDILEVTGLEDAKKEILWELYETGSDRKIGESLFYLHCKDDNMDGPEDCGNVLGDGKKEDKDDSYLNVWLFNGLKDEKDNTFTCDLAENRLLPPTITLLGDEEVSIEVGDDFIDPGAVAEDDLDGDLTSLITTETDLDILEVGIYTVTYTVIDFDGNASSVSRNVIVYKEDEFKCEKNITDLSIVYYGENVVDVVVYDKEKNGSVLQNFSTIEKGDILEVTGLEDAKKEILWELYETGSDRKIGESLFYLHCKDDNMDGPEDCGNVLGDGKKEDKDDSYLNVWLFNGLKDEKDNTFTCDLPETRLVPPTITLLGDEEVAIEIGDDFIDPGAVAEDNLDGDLTSLITTETDLDILAVGVYTVTYTVIDFDGNASSVSRNVTVYDDTTSAKVLESKVVFSSDDAEQTVEGKMYLNSSDLELVIDSEDLVTNTVGIRFINVNIPENAVITNAYIQFKVDEISQDDAQLAIYGEKSRSSSTFNQLDFNISSRPKTDASVSWEPDLWSVIGERSFIQRTPNLTPIIQEIYSEFFEVDSLTFIIDGFGTRTAEAYDGDVEGAPTLYVEYLVGTVIQTLRISPQIKRLLPINANEYELINPPDQGIIEINEETGDYAYKASAGASGQDVLKFKAYDDLTGSDEFIFNIELVPAPVWLNGEELVDFSSNLPLLIVDTNNETIPDEPKIKGVLTIIPPDASGRANLRSSSEYSDFMEIELRGSSSLRFPKNGFGLDTEDFEGEDNDVSLLGMPEEHKWVLHGPYSDKSLMRNYIAYNKTRDLGGYSAVRTKYVEMLVREGNSYRYHGVYVFMEKIKRDKNRVDISKLEPDETTGADVTGGYIMKYDREDEDWFFTTTVAESKIVMDYPDADDINEQQKAYIQAFMNSFEAALYASDYNDDSSENYYENFIDSDSFAKHLLARELFSDVDSWSLSEFFVKDKESRLSMLPVWDFNLSMGNANYGYRGATSGFRYDGRRNGPGGWLSRLMRDSQFRALVRNKWLTMRSGQWSDENLNAFIDETKALLQEAQSRNFERWPVLGQYIWPNRTACDNETAYCDTWDKAVEEHLRAWLLARAAWIDANLPQ